MLRTIPGFRWGRVSLFASVLLLLSVATSTVCFAASVKSLSQRYQDWLSKEVVYIISNPERDAFLRLTSDEARDKFIDHFWEIRNPTPGAPSNPYKDEHYRRLEHATHYFGWTSHTPGWKTDMGRVFITLGEPKQKQVEVGLQKVTPLEIWFYQNDMGTAALPPYFYVLFFRKDSSSEYKIYSPYTDGPEKLITSIVGPSRQQALKTIDEEAGREVARTSLSLLPDEPVDMTGENVNMASDVMLNNIRNLANNPYVKDQIAKRGRLLEEVSHRVVLGSEYLDLIAVPLRDSDGRTSLHYVLRMKKAEDFSVGQSEKGYYYNVGVSIRVLDTAGKLIFSRESRANRSLTDKEYEQIKGKTFGYEGVLPLPPGSYKLEFLITDAVKKTAFRQEKDVVIPDVNKDGLQVTPPVPFSNAVALPANKVDLVPFSAGQVKFMPLAGHELDLVQGRDLKLFYQIWLPAGERGGKDRKFTVEYAYGRMGIRDTKTVSDEITGDQFDAAGSVINGKKLSTADLGAGNYRLVVTVRDSAAPQKKAFASLAFRLVQSAPTTSPWDVVDERIADDRTSGRNDFDRAVACFAHGDKEQALGLFRSAFDKSPGNEQFYSAVVDQYLSRSAFARVTEVFSNHGVTPATDDRTIVQVATALAKNGNLAKAIDVLETALKIKPPTGPLYLALAGCYRSAGNAQKAADAERHGKELMSPSTPSSL